MEIEKDTPTKTIRCYNIFISKPKDRVFNFADILTWVRGLFRDIDPKFNFLCLDPERGHEEIAEQIPNDVSYLKEFYSQPQHTYSQIKTGFKVSYEIEPEFSLNRCITSWETTNASSSMRN